MARSVTRFHGESRMLKFPHAALLLALITAPLAAPPAWAQSVGAERIWPGCEAASAYSAARRGLSVLVLHEGESVCETYASGGGPDVAHEIWSGAKSFNGALAAVAIHDGLISSLDERVSDTITEWRSDPRRVHITIRQLLNLTSGVRSTVGRAPDYADALTAPLTAEPGERFQYGAAPFQIFGALIQRKLAARGESGDALSYLRQRLLDPLGMDSSAWRRTPAGDAMMSQGAVFTARDWARFGEFIRAGGRIDGALVVDERAFREMFAGSDINPSYAVSWWTPRRSAAAAVVTAASDISARADELPADLVMAAGAGDQRLYVIPSRGLTIVRQARFDVAAIREARSGRRRGAGDPWSDADFVLLLLGEEAR